MWRWWSAGLWAAGVLLAVGLQSVQLTAVSGSAKTFTIHWNSSNSIFRIDNTDHVIDVNRGNLKFEYDQAHLVCPVYTPGTRDDDMEKYIIYNVSRDEYETCRITNPNPRIIAVCDKPYKLMYFTITFRPFTPQPGGLEFLPGHDYYFISTSTSDDLHRRIGGRCKSHNMKIVFKVSSPQEASSAPATAPTHTAGQSAAPPQLTRPAPRPTPPATVITTTTTTGVSSSSTAAAAATSSSSSSARAPTKKARPYEKHPNEVVKSEELTLGGGGGAGRAAGAVAGALVLLCVLAR